jgi:hypothetical protein
VIPPTTAPDQKSGGGIKPCSEKIRFTEADKQVLMQGRAMVVGRKPARGYLSGSFACMMEATQGMQFVTS